MKQLTLILTFIFQVSLLYSQGISGRIFIKKDTAVSNVVVTAYKNSLHKGESLTDSSGYFSIPLFDTGEYKLVIHYLNNLDTLRIQISEKRIEYVVFTLNEKKYLMRDEIHICIPPYRTYDFDKPGTRTYTREEINQMPH